MAATLHFTMAVALGSSGRVGQGLRCPVVKATEPGSAGMSLRQDVRYITANLHKSWKSQCWVVAH